MLLASSAAFVKRRNSAHFALVQKEPNFVFEVVVGQNFCVKVYIKMVNVIIYRSKTLSIRSSSNNALHHALKPMKELGLRYAVEDMSTINLR